MITLDKIGIIVFWILGIISLVGIFFNPACKIIVLMCALMAKAFYLDLKKERRMQ